MGKKRDRSEADATSGKNTSGAELKLTILVAIGFRFRAEEIWPEPKTVQENPPAPRIKMIVNATRKDKY